MKRTLIKETDWIFPHCAVKPIIFCPKCGGGLLGDDAPHEITEKGEVNNSVVCGHNTNGVKCDFHEYVQLENWSHGHIYRDGNTWMVGDNPHQHC